MYSYVVFYFITATREATMVIIIHLTMEYHFNSLVPFDLFSLFTETQKVQPQVEVGKKKSTT